MKKMLLLVLAAVLAISAVCFAQSPANAEGYQKITPQQAKARMAEPGVIVLDVRMQQELLDVRMQQEYDAGHIANAVLLPLPLIEAGDTAVAKALPDKDAEILVYCRSGRRSAIAANALINMGYTNVLDFGGINDWPYEVVK